ncbi:MAG: hypothetical protein ACTSU5_18485 [Promethearchaeota archaeon]
MDERGSSNAIGGELLSGNAFRDFVLEYFDSVTDWDALRVTTTRGNHLAVHFLRCSPFQRLLDLLGNRAYCASLSHQHDVVKFLVFQVFHGRQGDLEVRRVVEDPGGGPPRVRWHDIETHLGKAVEVKTMNRVGDDRLPEFLDAHLGEVVARAGEVSRWWLASLRQVRGPKSRKGRACTHYLVLVELDPATVAGVPRGILHDEVVKLVVQTQEKAGLEDEVEGFFVPVKNIWLVERLRDELAEKDEVIAEKDEVIAEKDEVIAEKDAKLAKLERENAELRRRLEGG